MAPTNDDVMKSSSGDNVKVVVRCRPLSSTERQNGHQPIVAIDTVQVELNF